MEKRQLYINQNTKIVIDKTNQRDQYVTRFIISGELFNKVITMLLRTTHWTITSMQLTDERFDQMDLNYLQRKLADIAGLSDQKQAESMLQIINDTFAVHQIDFVTDTHQKITLNAVGEITFDDPCDSKIVILILNYLWGDGASLDPFY